MRQIREGHVSEPDYRIRTRGGFELYTAFLMAEERRQERLRPRLERADERADRLIKEFLAEGLEGPGKG